MAFGATEDLSNDEREVIEVQVMSDEIVEVDGLLVETALSEPPATAPLAVLVDEVGNVLEIVACDERYDREGDAFEVSEQSWQQQRGSMGSCGIDQSAAVAHQAMHRDAY
jgi:hypothetical protein